MFVSCYLFKFLKFYVSQTKKNCLNTYFWLLIFLLTSLFCYIWSYCNMSYLSSTSRFKRFSFGCLLVGSYWKKEKLAKVTTHCYLLLLVVPLVATCCTTRCHSLYHSLSLVVPLVVISRHPLSFIVTRCTIRCHSLSLDVSFVCLLINNQPVILKILTYCKIREIILNLFYINKFCTHAVLWLSKSLLIKKNCWLMFFGIGNHSYKYIKIWLHINKKCNIQAFTFREIKSFSVTLDFLLLTFWPF